MARDKVTLSAERRDPVERNAFGSIDSGAAGVPALRCALAGRRQAPTGLDCTKVCDAMFALSSAPSALCR